MYEAAGLGVGVIAGGGFALMAWRLARRRKLPSLTDTRPVERHRGMVEYYPASTEYYRIIDSAAAAWTAFAGARSYGICPRIGL